MDNQDLITAGSISDIEDDYHLLSDLGLRALFMSIAQNVRTSTS